jgi:hypothetical protein
MPIPLALLASIGGTVAKGLGAAGTAAGAGAGTLAGAAAGAGGLAQALANTGVSQGGIGQLLNQGATTQSLLASGQATATGRPAFVTALSNLGKGYIGSGGEGGWADFGKLLGSIQVRGDNWSYSGPQAGGGGMGALMKLLTAPRQKLGIMNTGSDNAPDSTTVLSPRSRYYGPR